MEPALDDTDRLPEKHRDLGAGQFLEVAQQDDLKIEATRRLGHGVARLSEKRASELGRGIGGA
jgi:hypothetical protein